MTWGRHTGDFAQPTPWRVASTMCAALALAAFGFGLSGTSTAYAAQNLFSLDALNPNLSGNWDAGLSKPTSWSFGSSDAFHDVVWDTWGTTAARGHGLVDLRCFTSDDSSCPEDPSRPGYGSRSYAVEVGLARARSCGGRYFTKISILLPAASGWTQPWKPWFRCRIALYNTIGDDSLGGYRPPTFHVNGPSVRIARNVRWHHWGRSRALASAALVVNTGRTRRGTLIAWDPGTCEGSTLGNIYRRWRINGYDTVRVC